MPIKPLDDQRTLVIAGAWNPAILSPNWVAKEILELPVDDNFQVGMQLAVNDPSQPIGFQFEGIAYAPALNILMFRLLPDLETEKAIEVAAKILELLPHTPVSGVGFNLVYEIDNCSDGLLKTFSAGSAVPNYLDDEQAELVKQGWGATIATKNRLINVTCKHEGGKVRIGFNVHIEVGSAEAASAALRTAGLFDDICADVIAIVNNVANEEEQ